MEAEVLELKSKVSEMHDIEKTVTDLRRRISQMESERDELLKVKTGLRDKLRTHLQALKDQEAAEEELDHISEERSDEAQGLIHRAFSGWKKFSVQGDKLALHLSMQDDKRLTQVFTTWKRVFQSQRQENIELLIAARDRRLKREKQATAAEEALDRKKKDLEQLRQRLEAAPPERNVPKAKIERLKLEKMAEAHWKKVQTQRAFLVFQEWKEAHMPYKQERLVEKKAFRHETIRKVFNGIKAFAGDLAKKRQIAVDRRVIAAHKLKKRVFLTLKERCVSAFRLQSVAGQLPCENPKKFFDAWRQCTDSMLEQKAKIRFLRRRFDKIQKDSFFQMLKNGVAVVKNQRLALEIALRVRETVLKRKRFYTFLERTLTTSLVSDFCRDKKFTFKKQVFRALLASTHELKSRRLTLQKFADFEQLNKRRLKREFLEEFFTGARQAINKTKVRDDDLGC